MLVIGWHVIGFDLMFLEKKCNEHLSFLLILRAEVEGFLYAAAKAGDILLQYMAV